MINVHHPRDQVRTNHVFEQAKSWLLPAESEPGHLVEHKEERDALSKWGNDLRQSYRTLAQAAGVSELDIHLLMNHSLPGVNAGYVMRYATHFACCSNGVAKIRVNIKADVEALERGDFVEVDEADLADYLERLAAPSDIQPR